MSKGFDYSKWDNIELSDDEDDVHPNIERESWFRMKHRSRVEREEKEEADKAKIRKEIAQADLRIKEITKMLHNLSNDSDSDDELEDVDGLKSELSELEKANDLRQGKLQEYEKNKKWNVDNMCHVVEERTIINGKSAEDRFTSSGYALPQENEVVKDYKKVSANKTEQSAKKESMSKPSKSAESTNAPKNTIPKASSTKLTQTSKKQIAGPDRESIAMLSYHDFTVKYADTCEEFMAITSLEKSKDFLILHGDILLQENASNYLLLASLEDEMNGLREGMRLRARQSQILSNITELAKTLKSHPGNVIMPFFKRLEEKEHLDGFLQGVEQFVANIIKRAVVKRKEIDEERAREAANSGGEDLNSMPKEDRLGPGGLDPVEVFESLPLSMQKAFESRDTDQLKEALLEMDPKEAERQMKRCVDSGLWNEK